MVECRICLEEDDPKNMISPCLCKGSRKYVHRQCLNEWRLCSNDEDNKTKCTICNFEYIIREKNTCENNILKYSQKIENYNLLNIISNFGKNLIISFICFLFTRNLIVFKIKSLIMTNYLDIDIFTLSTYILNLIYNLFLIGRIFISKNKIMLLKYYFHSGILLVIFYNFINILLIFLIPILGLIINLFLSFFYLKIIVTEFNKINKTDNLQILCLTEYDSLNI